MRLARRIFLQWSALRVSEAGGLSRNRAAATAPMLAMRLALHALNKVSLLAEGFGKACQPPKPKCFFSNPYFTCGAERNLKALAAFQRPFRHAF